MSIEDDEGQEDENFNEKSFCTCSGFWCSQMADPPPNPCTRSVCAGGAYFLYYFDKGLGVLTFCINGARNWPTERNGRWSKFGPFQRTPPPPLPIAVPATFTAEMGVGDLSWSAIFWSAGAARLVLILYAGWSPLLPCPAPARRRSKPFFWLR